ncbi:hypothetical protein EK21DRAFT_100219 [Setomelanomma holmii]|uniref:Alcohol acetyltransferase n=1 Tax=Setomelanomma holmii TaxID=210430 RepID=A0A9P4HAY8_9PLEO|nr:hypothetical protein EK21DRAFT_100219 [Setomelanomma holmii]
MSEVEGLQKLRPCGRLETFSTVRHHHGYYNNVALTAAYTISSGNSDCLEAQIYAALQAVIYKHPNLSIIIANEDKSYPDVYFARLPSIDLRNCVEFQQRKEPYRQEAVVDTELDHMLADQHNPPSDPANFTGTWVFHHALSDGTSALLFHDTFLEALNLLESSLSVNPIVKSPSTPLPPPFEDQYPMTLSWSYFLNALAQAFFPSIYARRPAKFWAGNPIPTSMPTPPKFSFRTFALSVDTTKQLAMLSKKEGVSVTATFQCLLAASIFAKLPADQYDTVKIDVPDDQMTIAIATYDFLHTRKAPDVPQETNKSSVLQYFSWPDARAVRSTIEAELAKEGRDNSVALLKYVSEMHKFMAGNFGKPRMPSVELSNLGVYRAKSTGKWKIERMTFTQCSNMLSAAFCVNVITGGDGCAVVNFSWCDGAVEEELVREVCEGLKGAIEELVETRFKETSGERREVSTM